MTSPAIKNASVFLTGIASLIMVVHLLYNLVISADYATYRWLLPVFAMSVPILFAWVGVLLRWKFPNPSRWIKWILIAIIPATYLFWTFVHLDNMIFWNPGDRCTWLYVGIMGFLIPPKLLEQLRLDAKWNVLLILATAFLYVGVSRIMYHFSPDGWQMPNNEWTQLFRRLMVVLPLALSIFFLVCFSFSPLGQRIGGVRTIGIISQVLAVLGMIICLIEIIDHLFFPGSFIPLHVIYRLLVQPISIYFLVIICRLFRDGYKTSRITRDVFAVNKTE